MYICIVTNGKPDQVVKSVFQNVTRCVLHLFNEDKDLVNGSKLLPSNTKVPHWAE